MERIESTDDSEETRSLGTILEAPVSRVVEEVRLLAHPIGRGEDVDHSIAIEVVDTTPTRESPHIHAGRRCDIEEPGEGGTRVALHFMERNQVLARDGVRILAERHVREVEEISGLEIIGPRCEEPIVDLDGPTRSSGQLVDAASLDREETRVGRVVQDAVLLLPEPHVRNRENLVDRTHLIRNWPRIRDSDVGEQRLEFGNRILGATSVEELVRVLKAKRPLLLWRRRGDPLRDRLRARLVHVVAKCGIYMFVDLRQSLDHGLGPSGRGRFGKSRKEQEQHDGAKLGRHPRTLGSMHWKGRNLVRIVVSGLAGT